MSALKPTLDEWVSRHDELCTCSMANTDDLEHCDCGQAERAAELAKMKTCIDEARKIIKPFAEEAETYVEFMPVSFHPMTEGSPAAYSIGDLRAAAAWLEEYKETP